MRRGKQAVTYFLKEKPDAKGIYSLSVMESFLYGNGWLPVLSTKQGKQAGFEVGRLWLDRVKVFRCQNDMQVDVM